MPKVTDTDASRRGASGHRPGEFRGQGIQFRGADHRDFIPRALGEYDVACLLVDGIVDSVLPTDRVATKSAQAQSVFPTFGTTP
jgi:hypothetical protein